MSLLYSCLISCCLFVSIVSASPFYNFRTEPFPAGTFRNGAGNANIDTFTATAQKESSSNSNGVSSSEETLLAPGEVETSCSETNVTINPVQFQHVWDLNGFPNYMARLDQWRPFIDLETKDIRFKQGVIGGSWNFQIIRNIATGHRLTLCAAHTPDHRKPNPHDRNFFFEFRVTVSLIEPTTSTAPSGSENSTTELPPTSTASTPEQPSSSSPASSTSPSSTPAVSEDQSNVSPVPEANPVGPVDPSPSSSPSEEDQSNSIPSVRRSLGTFVGMFNQTNGQQGNSGSAPSPSASPLVLQFGFPTSSGGVGPSVASLVSGIKNDILFGPGGPSSAGSGMASSGSSNNVTLAPPTFQQSTVSPKTHFTFWDFESKTMQLIRAKYSRNEIPPKNAQLILTFKMTELVLEKPNTNKKQCLN